MNSRKTKLIIIACLCVAVLGLSIGYALLSTRLNITGTAKVPANTWDVIFLEEEINKTETGMAKCSLGNIEGTSISGMSVEFTKPGDSCTFSIPVKNTGNISAKLVDVTGKSSNLTFVGSGKTALSDQELLQKNVIYEVNYGTTQINGNTDFSNIELLKADNSITITLRVTFKHSADAIPKSPVKLGGLDRGFIFESLSEKESEGQSGSSLDNIPNPPELNGDMIPVYYEATSTTTGEWKKADINNESNNWYDYNNQKWANAITVTSDVREEIKKEPVGTPIDMKDINTMWVWIPRYSYTIKSEDRTNYFGKASFENPSPTALLPGEIDIKFISKVTETGTAQYTGNTPTNWRTNEAFDFGGDKKSGIWVGKFEPTGSLLTNDQACINELCDTSKVTIKPELSSLRSQTVSSYFYMARSMQLNNASTYGFNKNIGDLHTMKNDEWGAVAYLSQSKYGKYGNGDYTGLNKEIFINNSFYITGKSGGSPNASSSATTYAYNDMTNLGEGQGQAGPGASTTGNIYGIYDMSGGAWDRTMGVLAYYEYPYTPLSGYSTTNNSGFKGKIYENGNYPDYTNNPAIKFPEEKYYNLYKVGTTKETIPSNSYLINSAKACNNSICYGQALSETASWYNDNPGFIYNERPWSLRGSYYDDSTTSGIFHSAAGEGHSVTYATSRLVLTP